MFFRSKWIFSHSLLLIISFLSSNAICDARTGVAAAHAVNPALELLIDKNLSQKKYKEAQTLLDNEIKKDPNNTTLLFRKAAIHADLEQYKDAITLLNQINKLEPNNEKANKLRKKLEILRQAQPHNEIGIYTDVPYVSDLKQYWNYSGVHYYRLTDAGSYGASINYASRYHVSGKQYRLELYPTFTKNFYASMVFGYANTTQRLFPNLEYRMEGFVDFPKGFEISLGQGGKKYFRFHNQKIFVYTGTLAKYIGDCFIWFRPSHFTPKDTDFYEVGVRYYFNEVDNYVALTGGVGSLPDIGDLPPIDKMIVLHQKGIALNGKFSLTKTVYLIWGAGFVKQVFPSGLRREITDGTIGINWRF